MARLRLLKVVCQPIFVIDDGDDIVERAAEPVVVPAKEWPTYATGRFAKHFEALRAQVEGEDEASNGQLPPSKDRVG